MNALERLRTGLRGRLLHERFDDFSQRVEINRTFDNIRELDNRAARSEEVMVAFDRLRQEYLGRMDLPASREIGPDIIEQMTGRPRQAVTATELRYRRGEVPF